MPPTASVDATAPVVETRTDRQKRILAELIEENGGRPAGFATGTFAKLYPELYAPPARHIMVGGRLRAVTIAAEVVEYMARAMADFALGSGAATEDQLLACGFTKSELATHGDRARMKARSLLSRRAA